MVNNLIVDKSGLIYFGGNGQTYLHIEHLIIEPGKNIEITGSPQKETKRHVSKISKETILATFALSTSLTQTIREKIKAIYQSNGYYQILPSYDTTPWEPPPPVLDPTAYEAVLACTSVALWLSQSKKRGNK